MVAASAFAPSLYVALILVIGLRVVGVREIEDIFLNEVLGGQLGVKREKDVHFCILNILLTALARSTFKSILSSTKQISTTR